MERIEIAALSKIADILSDNNKSPIIPEVDVWKKVFNNAELGDLYEEREPQFIVKIQPYGYGPEERDIYFNENTYNGLFESFKELQYRMDELAKLLNNVAKKMYLYRVLRVDADTEIVSKYCRNRRVDFDEFFESLPDNEQSNIIYKYCNKGVEELRRSLNILGFEIACENSEFCIVPFTARSEQSNFDINIINQELKKYSEELAARPQVIAANKTDVFYGTEEDTVISLLREEFEPKGIPVFPISAVSGKGVKELLYHVKKMLDDIHEEPTVFEREFVLDEMDFADEPYTVEYDEKDNMYVVEGPRIERMLGCTNMDSEKGFQFFQKFLKTSGILEELERLGIEEGDTVRMYDLQFDYYK